MTYTRYHNRLEWKKQSSQVAWVSSYGGWWMEGTGSLLQGGARGERGSKSGMALVWPRWGGVRRGHDGMANMAGDAGFEARGRRWDRACGCGVMVGCWWRVWWSSAEKWSFGHRSWVACRGGWSGGVGTWLGCGGGFRWYRWGEGRVRLRWRGEVKDKRREEWTRRGRRSGPSTKVGGRSMRKGIKERGNVAITPIYIFIRMLIKRQQL